MLSQKSLLKMQFFNNQLFIKWYFAFPKCPSWLNYLSFYHKELKGVHKGTQRSFFKYFTGSKLISISKRSQFFTNHLLYIIHFFPLRLTPEACSLFDSQSLSRSVSHSSSPLQAVVPRPGSTKQSPSCKYSGKFISGQWLVVSRDFIN